MIFNFRNIKCFLFDLDGTIWRWTELLPNVKHVISELEKKNKKIYFISNNALLSRKGFALKLTKLGIPVGEEQIINSGYVAAQYFLEKGIKNVYVVGEMGLIKELENNNISSSTNSQHVLISTDRNFTYWKLKNVMNVSKKGVKLYCVGHGVKWFVGKEEYPGEDPIVRAIEDVTGEKAMLLGKPSDYMKKIILRKIHLFPEDTLFVGDSLNSDIAFGNKCGFRTALTLTGITSLEQAKAARELEKPDFILKDIKELLR